MHREKGIYALIMSLRAKRSISIGQLGGFTFAPGWYVYLGSAHGGGGIKARTDRHRRSGPTKKKRWNIDYFRQFAPLSEIWFSHQPRLLEHDWAWSVFKMKGAEIPAWGFGAHDCRGRCWSHFFYFIHRPFPAGFRLKLIERKIHARPMYVEFVAPMHRDVLRSSTNATSLVATYDRGRRYLELLRRAHYDGLEPSLREDAFNEFDTDLLGRSIVERLAKKLSIEEEVLRDDAIFAEAVEKVLANCGESALAVLLWRQPEQPRELILELSQASPGTQRRCISGLTSGRIATLNLKQCNSPTRN
jgi:Uri superfamily endonuclease